jgi:hypothetical protein
LLGKWTEAAAAVCSWDGERIQGAELSPEQTKHCFVLMQNDKGDQE